MLVCMAPPPGLAASLVGSVLTEKKEDTTPVSSSRMELRPNPLPTIRANYVSMVIAPVVLQYRSRRLAPPLQADNCVAGEVDCRSLSLNRSSRAQNQRQRYGNLASCHRSLAASQSWVRRWLCPWPGSFLLSFSPRRWARHWGSRQPLNSPSLQTKLVSVNDQRTIPLERRHQNHGEESRSASPFTLSYN